MPQTMPGLLQLLSRLLSIFLMTVCVFLHVFMHVFHVSRICLQPFQTLPQAFLHVVCASFLSPTSGAGFCVGSGAQRFNRHEVFIFSQELKWCVILGFVWFRIVKFHGIWVRWGMCLSCYIWFLELGLFQRIKWFYFRSFCTSNSFLSQEYKFSCKILNI